MAVSHALSEYTDLLAERGWLRPSDYDGLQWDSDAKTIDYALLYQNVTPVLRIAYRNFTKRIPADFRKESR